MLISCRQRRETGTRTERREKPAIFRSGFRESVPDGIPCKRHSGGWGGGFSFYNYLCTHSLRRVGALTDCAFPLQRYAAGWITIYTPSSSYIRSAVADPRRKRRQSIAASVIDYRCLFPRVCSSCKSRKLFSRKNVTPGATTTATTPPVWQRLTVWYCALVNMSGFGPKINHAHRVCLTFC